MAALTVQNFASAAAGMAIAIALVRGFARHETKTIGNFWVDVTRATVYVLLPLSLVGGAAVRLAGRHSELRPVHAGDDASKARRRRSRRVRSRRRKPSSSSAPTAADSSTPTPRIRSRIRRRSPTLLQMLLIFLIPAGLTYTFGMMVEDTRQGWALFAAMSRDVPHRRLRRVLGRAGAAIRSSPSWASRRAATDAQPGGNMEGKEVRFGIAQSALFATVTTDASCGAVNGMHDSFTPLGGLVPLFNMQTGEVIFGGVGAGLYGILLYAILAVFIAGLMVGRTPEYLGKKIEQKEVKMAMLALIATAFSILVFTAISVGHRSSRRTLLEPARARRSAT